MADEQEERQEMSEIAERFLPAGAPIAGENLSHMTTIVRVLVALGLVLLSAPAAGAAPVPSQTGAACGGALVSLYTLHIEAKPRKKAYTRGDTILIDIEVTRPAEHDPAGEEQPMPRPYVEPAADVEVGGALWVGNTYRWDYGTTDEEGHAVLKVRMPKNSDTGWARGEFAAEKMYYSNNGCPDVREIGYASYLEFVRVDK